MNAAIQAGLRALQHIAAMVQTMNGLMVDANRAVWGNERIRLSDPSCRRFVNCIRRIYANVALQAPRVAATIYEVARKSANAAQIASICSGVCAALTLQRISDTPFGVAGGSIKLT